MFSEEAIRHYKDEVTDPSGEQFSHTIQNAGLQRD